MTTRKHSSLLLALLLGFVLLSLTGCFETTDKSIRKLRIFYSSDVVGSLEPCG
ncbi:MAG: hypothetical protein ABIK65_10830 [Candidatus Eisenbacteria bacterium]